MMNEIMEFDDIYVTKPLVNGDATSFKSKEFDNIQFQNYNNENVYIFFYYNYLYL